MARSGTEGRGGVTIRERIAEISRELVGGDVMPSVVRSSELTLSALLGNVGKERREAEMNYRRTLAEMRRQHEKANRAQIEAEATPEYARLLEAKGVEHEVEQLIITCRGYLRSLDSEMRLSR